MKKMQVLFAVSAMSLFGCAIPLAHVEAQQEFPRATANGCAYIGQGGNGNHARVNGLAYDAGDFFDRAAAGNTGVINACADLDMVHGYADLYKTYAQNVLYAPGQSDEGLKKEVEDTKAAVKELSDNVVDLATIATTPGVAPKGKGAKQQATSIVPAPAPIPVANTPPPTTNPASINPAVLGWIQGARNKAELVNVLHAAAQADPAEATMFNKLADGVGNGSDDNFASNKETLIKAFGGAQ